MKNDFERMFYESASSGCLPMLVITTGTADYGNKFVLRFHALDPNINKLVVSEECVVADSLKEIRKSVPKQCALLQRTPEDDPVIVETWI